MPGFISARQRNWQQLRDGLKDFENFLILPCATAGSEPSWFGFVLTIKDDAPFKRGDLVKFLEAKQIATRHIFGGNLARQPAYQDVPTRAIGDLPNTDRVMNNSFVIGVYPGINEAKIDYMIDSFKKFFAAL